MVTQFTRFKNRQGNPVWGIIDGKTVKEIDSPPFKDYRYTGNERSIKNVNFTYPVKPGKIICVGLNYRDHARELNKNIPEIPLIFLKASSSVTGPGSEIVKPGSCEQLDYEAELAAVVGKPGKNINKGEANDYLLGYTCFNDVTARDIQRKESQWSRAKSYDTFSPLGPYITGGIEQENLEIKLFLNGKLKQKSSTRNMIFTVPEIISFISEIMTLYPGDIIATGTPPGVGTMVPGDRVKIEIEKIGTLENTVRKEK